MKAGARTPYALLFVLTVGLGLASRRPGSPLPKDAGDVLYATMCFWLGAFLWPRASTRRLAAGAFGFCLAIELAKLIPSERLAALRHTRMGHLVLGTGFQASNLVCYLVGVLIAAGLFHLRTRVASSPDEGAPHAL